MPKIPIGVLTHFYTIMPIPKRVKFSILIKSWKSPIHIIHPISPWHHENTTHLLQSSTKPHKNVKKRWWFSKISTIWAKNPKVFQKLKNEKIYKNENANNSNNLLTTSFILSTNCKYKNKKIISLYISHSQPKTFFIITYV